jgi:hypothetical protein
MFDVRTFMRHPALGGLIGIVSAALFGTGAICTWLALRTMGDAPMVLTVREAVSKALEAKGGMSGSQFPTVRGWMKPCDNTLTVQIRTEEQRSC